MDVLLAGLQWNQMCSERAVFCFFFSEMTPDFGELLVSAPFSNIRTNPRLHLRATEATK